jgi:orotate phosphoribosyltransferase
MQNTKPSGGSTPSALEAARILLDIRAVNFRPEEPYIFTSGWASPVYIDCRKLISFPAGRRRITQMAVETIGRQVGLGSIDALAGGETAGIPYAAWIAEATSLPMVYVRKKPKGFGRNAQIEGDFDEGSRLLLIEDLTTDGASKINFVDALRKAGAKVTDTFVVFYYDVFPKTLPALKEAGIGLHYLTTWWDVLQAAEEGEYFPPESIAEVRAFLTDPPAWSGAHGGRSEY